MKPAILDPATIKKNMVGLLIEVNINRRIEKNLEKIVFRSLIFLRACIIYIEIFNLRPSK